MNPAVTLTFFRLGKISAIDAGAYIGAQFLGGPPGSRWPRWCFAGSRRTPR